MGRKWKALSIIMAGAMLISATTAAAATEKKDLVAYYEFDSVSGDQIEDLSGNKRAAALVDGAKLVDGKFGKAVQLNGEGAHILLPNDMVHGDSFTYSVWVNWAGGSNAQRLLDLGVDNKTQQFFITPKNVQGFLTTQIREKKPAEFVNMEYTFPENEWTHVALVVDGAVGKMYVNGEEVGTNEALTQKLSNLSEENNHIGKSKYPNDAYLSATLDRIAFYSTALSAAEVKQLGEGGIVAYEAPKEAAAPVPEPKPAPAPAPKPEPKPEPAPAPKTEPKPAPAPEPKNEPVKQAAPKPANKAESSPNPKTGDNGILMYSLLALVSGALFVSSRKFMVKKDQ